MVISGNRHKRMDQCGLSFQQINACLIVALTNRKLINRMNIFDLQAAQTEDGVLSRR